MSARDIEILQEIVRAVDESGLAETVAYSASLSCAIQAARERVVQGEQETETHSGYYCRLYEGPVRGDSIEELAKQLAWGWPPRCGTLPEHSRLRCAIERTVRDDEYAAFVAAYESEHRRAARHRRRIDLEAQLHRAERELEKVAADLSAEGCARRQRELDALRAEIKTLGEQNQEG